MTRRAPAARRPVPPGGSIDLLVVLIVAVAVWVRTPIGGLVDRAWARVLGSDADQPALTSYFVTGPPPEVVEIVETATLPEVTETVLAGALPEPHRTAVRLLIPDPEAALAGIDAAFSGDAEAALETWAIGADQRARGIARARAAGEAAPERYDGHRRYLPADAARRADRAVSGVLALSTALDLAWPVDASVRVSSPFGERVHPVTGKRKLHNGVDLATPVGTPVRAAQRGRVDVATEDDVNGRYVIVDHGHGVRTAYCHLDHIGVGGGAAVDRGSAIGRSGASGRVTGPHLHYVVRIGGTPVDPSRFRKRPEPPALPTDSG